MVFGDGLVVVRGNNRVETEPARLSHVGRAGITCASALTLRWGKFPKRVSPITVSERVGWERRQFLSISMVSALALVLYLLHLTDIIDDA